MVGAVAVLVVAYVLLTFGIWGTTTYRTNTMLATLADAICSAGGQMPSEDQVESIMDYQAGGTAVSSPLSPETPYSTRFFHVVYGPDGQPSEVDLHYIASVDEGEALAFANQALDSGRERGWEGNYRFKVCEEHEEGLNVLFVDGRLFRERDHDLLVMLMAAAGLFSLVSLFLMFKIMQHATKPIEESFERQKRFISNASHELKTPLTLILADADMEEWEKGPSEWIDGIRHEARDMSELITQMVCSRTSTRARACSTSPRQTSPRSSRTRW